MTAIANKGPVKALDHEKKMAEADLQSELCPLDAVLSLLNMSSVGCFGTNITHP